jgi:hypothetical protein
MITDPKVRVMEKVLVVLLWLHPGYLHYLQTKYREFPDIFRYQKMSRDKPKSLKDYL